MKKANALSRIKDLDKYLRTNYEFSNLYIQAKHQAFIAWFIKAQHGLESNSFRITDGPGDGGIDAVFEIGKSIYILQSKYDTTFKKKNIAIAELDRFELLMSYFTEKNSSVQYRNWLEKVNSNLHKLYNEIRESAIKKQRDLKFVFISTSHNSRNNTKFRCIDMQVISNLWTNYEEGYTPVHDSIDIKVKEIFIIEDLDTNFVTHVALVNSGEFMDIMDEDPDDKLFSYNVRSYISASSVNKEIEKSYKKNPKLFWLGHNGIYMTANNVSNTGGKTYRIDGPMIINGSQTLHTLHKSRNANSCDLLLRILTIDTNKSKDILLDIIKSTNSQNSMLPQNLYAHDPRQYRIKVFLDRYLFFYERRQNEWKNIYESKLKQKGYVKIGISELVKLLGVMDVNVYSKTKEFGFGTIRSNTKLLLDDSASGLYSKLFDSFSKDGGKAYHNLILIIWSYYFSLKIRKIIPKKYRNQLKTSNLLLIRLIYDVISQKRYFSPINNLTERHQWGDNMSKSCKDNICNLTKSILDVTLKYQMELQKKEFSMSYSNVFKNNEQTFTIYNRFFNSNTNLKHFSGIISTYILECENNI